MKLVYRAFDMEEAEGIAKLLRSSGIQNKILGQVLYHSGVSRLYGNQHPLTIWITNNNQYRAAIRAIWKANAIEGSERTRGVFGWTIPVWVRVFLFSVFLTVAVLVSCDYFER